MNDKRRKEIAAIKARIEELVALRDAIAGDIETIRDDEQAYFYAMPESIQGSDKGDKAQEAIDALQAAFDSLEEIDFEPIGESLDAAAQ